MDGLSARSNRVFRDRFWALEFNYQGEMISIRHGGRISRSDLAEPMDYRGILWNIDPFIRTKVSKHALVRYLDVRFVLTIVL